MVRLRSLAMPSAQWMRLKRIKTFNAPSISSGSPRSTQEVSQCSSASLSHGGQKHLSSGMIIVTMFVTSLDHSAHFRETSTLSSTSVKVSTGTTSSSAKPSSTHGTPMVGSSHQGFQKRCQIKMLKSFIRFTCPQGSVMRSITCTTSGLLMASCSTVMWNQDMAGTSSTVARSGQRSRIFLRSQKMCELVSCASSSTQSQCQCQMTQSSMKSSYTSSSRIIKYGQLSQNFSITISQPCRSYRIMSSIMRVHRCHHGSCMRPLSSTSSNHSGQADRADPEDHQVSSPPYGELIARLKWGTQDFNHGDRHREVIHGRRHASQSMGFQDSNSMEVDEGIIKTGKKSSSGSANAILTFNAKKIIFK